MKQNLTIHEFSLVAFPFPHVELIHNWKQLLEGSIHKFTSSRSTAHATVAEFRDQRELDFYMSRIRTFCQTVTPMAVTFDKFVFGTETFFVAPNEFSKNHFNQVLLTFIIILVKKDKNHRLI